jgi:xyloglucan-specific exo-beta-1,4-glucanase
VPYKFGLPNVIIDELEIHYGSKKIVAATYGRGVWQNNLRP